MFKNKLMTTAMSVAFGVVGTVQGAAQEAQSIDVPAQPLAAAIDELSRETGHAILADARLVHGKTSKSVRGKLTVDEALKSMVAGSGLSFLELADRSFALTENNRQGVGSSQDNDFLLDEVVIVEGEKIGRSLQEITPSIVVLSDDVDRPQNFDQREAIQGIPNVLNEEGADLPSIRGIDGSPVGNASAFSTGAQPRVPIIVDGVPRPLTVNAGPSLNSVWDVEAIEVARGPQATTTGRNAFAGAVRVQTKDPTNKLEGKARLNYFNQDGTVGGALLFNVPIVDEQLAIRFTAEASDGESFVEVLPIAAPPPFGLSAESAAFVEDEEFRRFRGKILFTPTAVPGLEVKFSVDDTTRSGLSIPGEVDAPGDALELSTFNPDSTADEIDQRTYSGSIKYELSDRIVFEAKAAFLDNTFIFPSGLNFFFDFEQSTETIVAEGFVRFQDFGRLSKGLFGVAYENQADEGENTPFFLPLTLDAEINNIGIFGEAEFDITDKLTLIAGARVEIDDRDRFISFTPFGLPTPNVSDTSVSETAFIPKVGLRYDFDDNLGIGYTYSQGFRPGGTDFDIFTPSGAISEFGSERLRQHEIFLKTQQLDGRLNLNASAFYYRFLDAQVGGAAPDNPPGAILIGNVPVARGIGLELDGSFEILDGLTLSAGLGLLDTEITDAGPVVTELQGADLPRAPGVTANGSLSYTSDSGFSASVNARFVGSTFVDIDVPDLDSYVVVDLAAGYEYSISDRVVGRIDGFINNVADNRFITENFGDSTVTVGRPRTFGIAGTISF
ncbi:MAG: TonB-dependent receptor [Pseudomonadota bacterium]